MVHEGQPRRTDARLSRVACSAHQVLQAQQRVCDVLWLHGGLVLDLDAPQHAKAFAGQQLQDKGR